MTAEDTTTARQRLADGFTPLNPPTHIRVDFKVPETGVEGHVVIEIEPRLEIEDIWKQDPAFNYAHDGAYEDPARFLQPFEYDDNEEGFITDDMAVELFDAVGFAAEEAGVPFEWDHLNSADVWILAWRRSEGSIQLDYAYGEEHNLRVSDCRLEVAWTWGGPELLDGDGDE